MNIIDIKNRLAGSKAGKKVTAAIMAIAITLGTMFSSATVTEIEVSAASASTTTLYELQKEMPNGTVYDNRLFHLAWQCHGCVRYFSVRLTGLDAGIHWRKYDGSSIVDYINNIGLKCGDIIRTGNNAHSIMILSVNGSTIRYVDANGNNDNRIYWNRTGTIDLSNGYIKTETRPYERIYYILSCPVELKPVDWVPNPNTGSQNTQQSIIRHNNRIMISIADYYMNACNGNDWNGVPALADRIDYSPESKWRICALGDGSYRLYVMSSNGGYGRCLDVYKSWNGSRWVIKSGCRVDIYSALKSEQDAQSFIFTKVNGKYAIRLKSDPSLAITVSGNHRNAYYTVEKYTASPSQLFTFTLV